GPRWAVRSCGHLIVLRPTLPLLSDLAQVMPALARLFAPFWNKLLLTVLLSAHALLVEHAEHVVAERAHRERAAFDSGLGVQQVGSAHLLELRRQPIRHRLVRRAVDAPPGDAVELGTVGRHVRDQPTIAI